MAQLVIGAAGAAVGFLVGGPTGAQVGWALGSMVGGSLAAPDQQGPRIADRQVQLASYGAPIPAVYGGYRLAGTLIWSTDLIESESTESAKGGPEVTSYSYSVSCAVAVAGRVGGYRRIWADAKLVYDISEDADVATQAASLAFAEFMTVYTGTESQMPDPTIEGVEGVGDVEAFRGTAYVVFTGLPLGDYGNRIPNFMFEVTGEEVEEVESLNPLQLMDWSFETIDADTGARAVHGYPLHGRENGPMEFVVLVPSGISGTVHSTIEAALAAAAARGTVLGYNAGQEFIGYSTSTTSLASCFDGGATVADNPRTVSYAFGVVGVGDLEYIDSALVGPDSGALSCPIVSRGPHIAAYAAGYVLKTVVGGTTSADYPAILNYCSGIPGTPALLAAPWTIIRATRLLACQGNLCLPGDPCASTTGQAQIPGNPAVCLSCAGDVEVNVQAYEVSGTYRVMLPGPVYNGSTTYLVRNAVGPALASGDPNYSVEAWWRARAADDGIDLTGLAFGVGFGVVTAAGACSSTALPGVAAGSAVLGDIVSDICVAAGLTTGQIDVTELTDGVLGFARGRVMPARAAIEALRSAFHFDAVESGDEIRFVKRGGAPVATLTLDDIGAGIDSSSEPLDHDRAQEAELPSAVAVAYQSPAIDFQTGVQQARRRVGGSQQINQVELPIVMTDLKAAEVADVLLYDSWASRTRRTFRVGMEFARLEPTDIVEVDDGAAVYELRIVDKMEEGGVVTLDCRDNDVASYSPNSTAATPSGGGSSVRFDGPTKLYLLDMPLLRDADDGPGYYLAATGYFSRWPGAATYRSVDDGAIYTPVRDATARVISGHADTVLAAYAGGNTVDEINSVDVTVLFGELASVTRAQLLNSGNPALIGDEVVQFQRAELLAGSTYRLTGLLRGRFGTERHMTAHAAGERFVMLSVSTMYRIAAPLSEIDEASVWKAATFGSGLADAYEVDFTNTAVGLTPLSPLQLFAARSGGQYLAQWVRRTRFDATWRPLVDAPLGEASESYRVRVLNGDAVIEEQVVTEQEAVVGSADEGYTLTATATADTAFFAAKQVGAGAVGVLIDDRDLSNKYVAALTALLVKTAQSPALGHQVIQVSHSGAAIYVLAYFETAGTPSAYIDTTVYRIQHADVTTVAASRASVSPGDFQGVAHDGTDLWVVASLSNGLLRCNPSTLATVNTYSFPSDTLLRVFSAGGYLWVSTAAQEVIQVDPATGAQVHRVDASGYVTDVAVYGGTLLVVSAAGLDVFDLGGSPAFVASTACAPSWLLASRNAALIGDTLFVIDYPNVAAFDAATGALLDTINVAGGATYVTGDIDADPLLGLSPTFNYLSMVTRRFAFAAPTAGPDYTGFSLEVCQVSASIGAGFPATITL